MVLLAQMASVALVNARLYQAVQSNEHRLRAVVESSPLAIAEVDMAGEAQWWNGAASALFGWDIADELYDTATVSDALWDSLAARFTEEQLIELIVVGGWYRLIGSVINATRVPLEPWAARFP